MAADWIKMRVDLYRDPKVCVIADQLMDPHGDLACYVSQLTQRDMSVTRNVTRNVTVGALVTVWGVMRQRGKRRESDLICHGVRLGVVDDVADLPGFGAAMASVGWVEQSEEGIVFPGFFDEYNVDPQEKQASSAADRQRRYREKGKNMCAKSDVTRDVTRDVTVTHRVEKEKEIEKREEEAGIAAASLSPATAEDSPMPSRPACPHQKIIDLYHQQLPELRQVREWNATRRDMLARRWAESTERQSLDWWAAYFGYVRKSRFLMGQTTGRDGRSFDCDLEWLIRPTNFAKVVEGKYEDQAA